MHVDKINTSTNKILVILFILQGHIVVINT